MAQKDLKDALVITRDYKNTCACGTSITMQFYSGVNLDEKTTEEISVAACDCGKIFVFPFFSHLPEDVIDGFRENDNNNEKVAEDVNSNLETYDNLSRPARGSAS